MGKDIKVTTTIYFRKKENWFKELLIKLKIIKPKYSELEGITPIGVEGENDE